MLNKFVILLGTIVLFLFSAENLFGQETKQSFINGDFSEKMKDITHVVIKAGKKTYDFKMDTLSIRYKTIIQINPKWIKTIDVLKNKGLEGPTQTFLIITLKRGKLKKLPLETRKKFN